MPTRDDDFCYELVVAAAQMVGSNKPTYDELITVIRTGHKALNKRMPNMKYLRKAIRRFNSGGPNLLSRDMRGG